MEGRATLFAARLPQPPGPAGSPIPARRSPRAAPRTRARPVLASPAEHSRTQEPPGLTCRAVRHAQHRTQRGERAQGFAAALFAHSEHLDPAAGRRAGHEQHVLAAAEVRRFLFARHYSLRPEGVQVVKLHHGPEDLRCSSEDTTRSLPGRRPALPRWAEPGAGSAGSARLPRHRYPRTSFPVALAWLPRWASTPGNPPSWQSSAVHWWSSRGGRGTRSDP